MKNFNKIIYNFNNIEPVEKEIPFFTFVFNSGEKNSNIKVINPITKLIFITSINVKCKSFPLPVRYKNNFKINNDIPASITSSKYSIKTPFNETSLNLSTLNLNILT